LWDFAACRNRHHRRQAIKHDDHEEINHYQSINQSINQSITMTNQSIGQA
jgi:hypothetical protein